MLKSEDATTRLFGFSRKELSSLLLLLIIGLLEYRLILVSFASVCCILIGWFAGASYIRGKLKPTVERLIYMEEKYGSEERPTSD